MSDVWIQDDGFTPAGFESAAGHSTIAYMPHSRAGRCAAKDHTCKAFHTKRSKYCAGHERAILGDLKGAA